MGAVSNIVGAVGDVIGGAVEAVKDVGSFVDDAVNDVVPGGWLTVGAATGLGALGGLGELGAAAAETAAAEGATGLATLGESVLPASEAFATGSELAAAAEGAGAASPWGLNASLPTSTTAEFGTFNPSIVSAPSINTGALSGMEYLGGTGSLAAGTAGLTAEQLANATALGQVGTNAASGLGYLGGASSLPSGTAGITGVTTGGLSLTDAQNIAKAAKGLMGSTAPAQTTGGTSGLAALVRGNQSPFNFGQQTPIQGTTTNVQPTYLGQLANLLKG